MMIQEGRKEAEEAGHPVDVILCPHVSINIPLSDQEEFDLDEFEEALGELTTVTDYEDLVVTVYPNNYEDYAF